MSEERVVRSLISAEEGAKIARWLPTPLDGSAVNAEELDQRRRGHETSAAETEAAAPPRLTAEELAAIRRSAYDEGYAEGLSVGKSDGLRAGEAEVRRVREQWQRLVEALAEPLAGQTEAVEQELLRLSVALASQLVRREIRQDPGQIIAVIREALSYLPVSRQLIRVNLHPDDASFVRDAFALDPNEERTWQIQDDPTITRGGCRIATETSNLDATLETRIATLVSEMMGGERDAD